MWRSPRLLDWGTLSQSVIMARTVRYKLELVGRETAGIGTSVELTYVDG